jgi:hypothetical protein
LFAREPSTSLDVALQAKFELFIEDEKANVYAPVPSSVMLAVLKLSLIAAVPVPL